MMSFILMRIAFADMMFRRSVLDELPVLRTERLVVRLLDPVFVVGKQVATSRFEIPSEREVERVAPALEEVMAQAATELLGDE